MESVTPEKLTDALRIYMRQNQNDGLYIVSMDHSPSEQLTGEDWHTTVLVLSSGVEHSEIARRIAQRLRPNTEKLTKWVNASRAYRRNFLNEFFNQLASFPVYVFALSAQETTIWKSITHFIKELGLDKYYHRSQGSNKKVSITLGPFLKAPNGEPSTLILSEKRAVMCLFISHFVLRMHRQMYEAINASSRNDPGHVNWNFYGDKFPGPQGEDMDPMFQILSNLDRNTGRIAWGYFKQGDTVESDLLADNLAGLLNAYAGKHSLIVKPSEVVNKGFFYWENWT